jgi:hypothetical protein
MHDEAEKRRAERAEHATYHYEARRRREELESAKAQVIIERFVAEAVRAKLPTEELTARPWSGRGRYRTGVVGWYLRRDRSLGVGVDARFARIWIAATDSVGGGQARLHHVGEHTRPSWAVAPARLDPDDDELGRLAIPPQISTTAARHGGR